jgi:putative RecB family exonuclease
MSPAVAMPTAHVSVSSVTTYIRCPRQYEHRYQLGTPPSHRPGSLAFGSAVHSALALFYGRLMQGMAEPSVEELADELSDAWSRELHDDIPVLFDNDDTPDGLRDRGVAMLRVFHEKAPRPACVLAVEDSFRIEVVDDETGEVLPDFVGRFDALVEDDDGRTRLLEHKTAARRYSESKLAHDLQPSAYSLALSRMGIKARVTYQVLLKTKVPALELYEVERGPQDYRDLIETIIGVHRAVEAGAFHPIRDWWCQGCPYAVSATTSRR